MHRDKHDDQKERTVRNITGNQEGMRMVVQATVKSFLNFLNLEDGTNRLFENVCTSLQIYAL
jgi:hypothetical protein